MANIDRNCSALLRKVYEASFAVDDVILYLDTHPNDAEAFELFRQYTAMEQEARAAYVANHGPVLRSETAESKTYTWLNDPWPWNFQEGGTK